jgi:hypothetical protein
MLVFRPCGLESYPNSVTLLGACYATGLGDGYDNDMGGEYEEAFIACALQQNLMMVVEWLGEQKVVGFPLSVAEIGLLVAFKA